MKVLRSTRARNFKEAADVAFGEAGVVDMSTGVTDLFSSTVDLNKLGSEARKTIATTIRGRYKNPTWDSDQWFVPIPVLHYDTREIPHLTIEIRVYLVAVAEVETAADFYDLTLVGPIGNPERLVLPMSFLLAILDNDLDRFRVVAKDGTHTSWEVPGAKVVQLPNDFLNNLSQILEHKSVAVWLLDFGSQGRKVAPLVIGTLWGLQSMGVAPPIPIGKQAWSREIIINDLVEGLDYKIREAEGMFDRATSNLRADYTREEALRAVLQQAGKGE